MWRYSYNLRSLYETPVLPATTLIAARPRPGRATILQTRAAAGRTLLTEAESKQLLAAYGIPDCRNAGRHQPKPRPRAAAERLGYPVVAQAALGNDHPQDRRRRRAVEPGECAGGAQGLPRDRDSVREKRRRRAFPRGDRAADGQGCDGYELILGSSVDPQFGPVLLFGAGGQLVEVFKDRALALPPLNTTLARRLMEQTHIYTALKGVRGRNAG